MSTSELYTQADTTHHQSELSPNYEALKQSENGGNTQTPFNMCPVGSNSQNDLLSNDGGDLNGEKRKKKKKKNKKKKHVAGQDAEKEASTGPANGVKVAG